LLAGYGLHVLLAILRGGTLMAAPARTLDLIGTLRHMYSRENTERPGGTVRLAALTFPAIRAVARRILSSQRVLDEALRRHSFDPSVDADEPTRMEQAAIDRLGPLTGVLYHSFHRESLPRILRNFDAYSMGRGIEVRMPFLDWRVVRYAFSVPDVSKAGGGYAKRLLREAMRGVLPEPVRLRRDKLGYNAPVADWLQHGLADWLWDELNDPEFLRSDLWPGHALLALARAKRDSGAQWQPAEMRRVTMAVTAHFWLTRWIRGSG
jgi:asparagine synthetase B (glutamine-hydrolysing)